MFLLVSVRHVGAHPGEHQHGVSIQISINLGKTFLRISRIRNIPLTWILARVFVYVPPFISQILDFIYWTVLIFILIYFEWRDTENQQYGKYTCTFWCITVTLIKVLCMERFKKYFNSFRSTMQHHQHTKKKVHSTTESRKIVGFTNAKAGIVAAWVLAFKMSTASKWTYIDPLHRQWKKLSGPCAMN